MRNTFKSYLPTGMCLCGDSVELEEHVIPACSMDQDWRQEHGDLGEDSNLDTMARRDKFDKRKEQKEN